MLFIVGDRQSGKTRLLTKISCRLNIPILVPNKLMANEIERSANRWGMSIPKPRVLEQHIDKSYPEPVLVDEVSAILQRLGYAPTIVTIMPSRLEILEERGDVSLKEALSVWLRSRRGCGHRDRQVG